MDSSPVSNHKNVPKDNIDNLYRYWRVHIMFTMYVGYAAFYFTRKNFNYVMPVMISDLGLEKADIGMMSTLFYLCYGCSKFISGMMSDNSRPRYFMGFGLIMTGIINILFGFSSSVLMLTFLWVLNAWFQGWGAPACARLLTSWYSQSERGCWWGLWNTAHNIGGALIPLLVSYLTLHYSWLYGFIVPGCIGVIVGLFLCFYLRDTPKTMGLPSIGSWRNDHLEQLNEYQDSGLSYREILRKYVIGNKYIWLLGISYALVYIVRTSISDWGNLYLTERYDFDLITANSAVSLFEVGGFCGSLLI